MKSAKVRFLIASTLTLLLYGAEAFAKDVQTVPATNVTVMAATSVTVAATVR